jgi:hypothetical protein
VLTRACSWQLNGDQPTSAHYSIRGRSFKSLSLGSFQVLRLTFSISPCMLHVPAHLILRNLVKIHIMPLVLHYCLPITPCPRPTCSARHFPNTHNETASGRAHKFHYKSHLRLHLQLYSPAGLAALDERRRLRRWK